MKSGRQILRSEPPGEFLRVTQSLFASAPMEELKNYKNFDSVFKAYHRSLVNLGRLDDAGNALELYYDTLAGKDARFINYCDMQSYMHWIARDFVSAIKWGQDGADLKQASGVDTPFSSDHNLALAQRDSGAIDPALKFFIGSADIDDVLDPEEIDKTRGGSFYGNIGRCFDLMGQIDSALICYAKSAQLVEKEHEDSDLENQAYIRQWIGELLIKKGEKDSAVHFLVASIEKWKMVSPPKAERVLRTINTQIGDLEKPTHERAEAFALRWISARGHS